MSQRLDGRVAVVTGGATGIGQACARAFAAAGASVMVGDIDDEGGARTVAEIVATGGTARFMPADMGQAADCAALVGAAEDAFGGIDILHANAGMELCRSIWDTTEEEWDHVMAVNLGGTFHCARAAMRSMRARGRPGVILITASPHAFMTSREIAAYAASKGGQVALMRAIALEGAPYGIRANALLPGAIDTPMLHREAAFAHDPAVMLRRFAEAHPMNRLGRAADIAQVAVFLASDDAGFVTGTCVAVDGGLMATLSAGPAVSYAGPVES
ncbi:MAG: SDR family NAD(P)-dependent oxidoreductase [Rhodopila sp.]|nr:SDR family NAD(P)-dependent oxidoreductase [Rhodopila sp.]